MSEEKTVDEVITQDNSDEQIVELPTNDDGDYVINLNQENTDAVQEQETAEVSLGEQAEPSEEVADEVRESEENVDQPEDPQENVVSLGEVSAEPEEDESTKETGSADTDAGGVEPEPKAAEPTPQQEEVPSPELPEGFEKMLEFLKDHPGATPEEYIAVTKGADAYTPEQLVKMHIASEAGLDAKEDAEEIQFLYEDKFSFDEELDEERDVKLKKIEFKKVLKQAKENLDASAEKYKGDLTFKDSSPETKEALKFFEQHKTETERNQQLRDQFQSKTEKLFNDGLKGFEFEYGDGKKQTIRIADVNKVSKEQSDITNFINKYVGDDGSINDLHGYHKALWAANNVDALFSHAYEQGKADAVRNAARNAKNINMEARQDAGALKDGTQQSKFKLVDDNSEGGFKFKFGN